MLNKSSAYVKSNGEWIARCLVMGFFIAPIEALPEISVTDIYFTHQRGTYVRNVDVQTVRETIADFVHAS